MSQGMCCNISQVLWSIVKYRIFNICKTASYFCSESINQYHKFSQVSAVWFAMVTAVSKDNTITAENYASGYSEEYLV